MREVSNFETISALLTEMNGIEFMKTFLKRPESKGVPVVFMSATGEAYSLIGKYGTRGFIRKPVDLHSLLEYVGDFIPPAVH